MPFTIRKRGDKNYCLHKVVSGGNLGRRLGCHSSRDDAVEQQQTIAISEEGEKSSLPPECLKLYKSPVIAGLIIDKCGCQGGRGKITFSTPSSKGLINSNNDRKRDKP